MAGQAWLAGSNVSKALQTAPGNVNDHAEVPQSAGGRESNARGTANDQGCLISHAIPHFESRRLVSLDAIVATVDDQAALADGPGGTTARAGRPRSQATRRAILDAVLDLTAEAGYRNLTVDGIADRAGAGKQTIYRWWPSKDDVLLEALALKAELDIPIPDTGSYREDMRVFLTASFTLGRQHLVIDVLRALMARAQLDDEFGQRFRGAFLQRRRDVLAVIVRRAQERGDLPSHLRPGTIADIVFGVIWYRVLATGQLADGHLADELVAALAPDNRTTQ